jgi:hypothetical protein
MDDRRESKVEITMDEMLLAMEARFKEMIKLDLQNVKFDDKTKRDILISCLAALCIGNMMLDNIYAFLPQYVEHRNLNNTWADPGAEITPLETSEILAVFSIA